MLHLAPPLMIPSSTKFGRYAARVAFIIILLGAASAPADAQPVAAVTGRVVTAPEELPLAGATVVAKRLAPDSVRAGTITSSEGTFYLEVPAGDYRMRISFIGYEPVQRRLTLEEGERDLGTISMTFTTFMLDEAQVEVLRDPVSLRGDTTVYNASSFQVNPDANTEDLVSKMPGIFVEDGTVQAQGEDVQRVLVDGEEFFGSDAAAALRNLPAEIVQQIEVYDRKSDQAQFTGFDDGNEEKTINIVTRPDRRHGQFGRALAGYGTDTRYAAGGALNIFDGARRITAVGLTNNVGRQNFNAEDLLGVMRAGRSRRGRRGRGSRGRGGGAPGRFLLGQVDGIPTTHSFGVNYNDDWGSWADISGSYFMNRTDSDADALLEREYFLADQTNRLYTETSDARNQNTNHRLNARLESTLSEATDLIVRPRLSMQQNTSDSELGSRSALPGGSLLSEIANTSTNDNTGYAAATDVLVRHRLPKRGRTISMNLGFDRNSRWGDTDQDVEQFFYDGADLGLDSTNAYERRIDSDRENWSLSANLVYTEPLGERGQLEARYRPSFSRGGNDQEAFRLDEVTGTYDVLDSAYTARSDRRVLTQRGGLSYQHRGERFRGTVGIGVQNERLAFEQAAPQAFDVQRSYFSVLPSARLRLDLQERSHLTLSYRTSTNTPSARQLTDVIDDSNPLLITGGNSDLETSTSHRVRAQYRSSLSGGEESLFGFMSVRNTQNYVGSATIVASGDTTSVRGITLEPGAQLIYPVNLESGYWSGRSVLTYGRPVSFLQSNMNVRTSLSYTRTPGLVNGTLSRTDAFRAGGRLFLGSDISERVDFSLSYGLQYTKARGTAAVQERDGNLRHRGQMEVNLLPWGDLVLDTDLNVSYFAGLSEEVDPMTARWDIELGYKFLNRNQAEVRLAFNDVLNQQGDVTQDVTDRYIESRETETLGRHLILSLTYRLRRFSQ